MAGRAGFGRLIAVLAACGLAWPATAIPQSTPSAPRTEVPIHDVRLSDGVHRYGVPMTIGGTSVLAGLDTGAAGLRLMPDALKAGEVRAGRTTETYSFGSGARLAGVTGQGRIAIGGLAGPASLHLVQKVDCIERSPGCPGRLGLGYGFLGDGLAGEGFRVLIGANMGRTSIDHPLRAVGARRWIIEVPRPGDNAPGRLILNPTDAEVADFVAVRLVGGYREEQGGGLHDAVPGCLRNEATGQSICGIITLDTGAFLIRALNVKTAQTPWTPGAPMTLEFRGEDGKPTAPVRMTVGGQAQGAAFGTAPRPETILQLGTAPYLAYSVLYDPVRGRLGFKARPPVEGLPAAGPKRP